MEDVIKKWEHILQDDLEYTTYSKAVVAEMLSDFKRVKPSYYLVMNPEGEDWKQLSIAFNTYDEARDFRDSKYTQARYKNAVIMAALHDYT